MSASLSLYPPLAISPPSPVYPLPAPSLTPPHPPPSRLEDSVALRLCAPKELKLSAGEAVKWKNLIALREKPSLFICKFLGHAFFPPSTLFFPFYTYLSLSHSLSVCVTVCP